MDRCVPETPTAPVCATARRAPRPAAVRAALALALVVVAAATFTGRAHARASQPFAARAGLDLARSAAMAWAEDAVLIYVENDEPLDARGASTRWGYLFFSASHDESRAYSIENGKIVVAETLALKFEAPPLGADWIDSGAALTVAEEASREFRGKAGDDLVVDLAPELDRLFALLVANEAPNSGARLSGRDESQPARLRMLRFRSQDFDLVAVLEHRPQRHDAPVDLCADGAVAEARVHRIGKIHGRRSLGQLDQLALWSEGEDPVLVHRHPGMLEELFGGLGVVEDLDEIVDPGHVDVGGRLAFLVSPVGGKAALRLLMHLPVADLDFDPHLRIVDDRGVQRLVTVALRCRDVVLEAAGNHRPTAVNETERPIAIHRLIHDDPKGHHVRQLLEADMPLGHLLPDRIRVLLAADDFGFQAIVGKVELKAEADTADQVAALFVELLQPPGD